MNQQAVELITVTLPVQDLSLYMQLLGKAPLEHALAPYNRLQAAVAVARAAQQPQPPAAPAEPKE